MNRKNWFDKEAEERTKNALILKHDNFAEEHKDATDEQLVEYLKQCAKELEKSPTMYEVIGGRFIAYRLGGWGAALVKAGLPPAGLAPKADRRKIYRDEYKVQTAAMRKAKVEKSDSKVQAKKERQAKVQEKREEISQRDAAWAELHKNDSDEQLLKYLRQKAAELGHTPYRREVEGATMIAARFGEWAIAITLAGLELPKDVKAPNPKKLAQVRKVINSKNAENK